MNVDIGINKNVIESLSQFLDHDFELKMPSELLGVSAKELDEILKELEQPQRNLGSLLPRIRNQLGKTETAIEKTQ